MAALAEARAHEERAWKLTSLIDRLLFATSPRGGHGNKSFAEVLQKSLRLLERGGWAAAKGGKGTGSRGGGGLAPASPSELLARESAVSALLRGSASAMARPPASLMRFSPG